MDMFKAQSAEIVVDGDVLTLTKKKIGADDVRRIPLAALTDLRVRPGGRFSPTLLQLVLNGEAPAEMTNIEPNTLVFPSTPKHKEAFESLHALLAAAVDRNRQAGGGPVAYDGPKKGWLDRTSEKLDAAAVRQREQRAARLAAELTSAGITRPDLVAAGHATAGVFGMAAGMPKLAQVVRPDEQVLQATHASVDGDSRLVAITSTRVIIVDAEVFSSSVEEFPLTAVVVTTAETEWLGNELEIRLRSGYEVELENLPDLAGFAAALRDAVHRATTPRPVTPAPAPPPVPQAAPQPQPAPPVAQPDVLGQVAKLGELHAAGVLTDEEFQAKKAQLLDRL
jgi:hypothetical protein